MKPGTELISEERQRQISVEGWTSDHDDEHSRGEMAGAAAAYALEAIASLDGPSEIDFQGMAYDLWPWGSGDRKGCDPVRKLAKAGALIAAEIDRLQRLLQ